MCAVTLGGRSILSGTVIFALAIGGWSPRLISQTDQKIRISGVVIEAVGGKPADGVTMTLLKRSQPGQAAVFDRAITDDKGAFTVWAPSVGEYSLSGFRPRYGFAQYNGDPFSGFPTWFTISGPRSGLIIKLWEGPKVAGAVLDENGQPVRCVVRLLEMIELGGRQVLRARNQVATRADGTYSLQTVAPGTFFVAASPPLPLAPLVRPTQYYLSASTVGTATPLDLKVGETAERIDFHLKRERGFVISGTLDTTPGRPSPQLLQLYDMSATGLPSDFVIAETAWLKDGRFSFPPVPPGSYEVRFVRYAVLPVGTVPDGTVRYSQQSLGPERLASVPDGPTWWLARRIDVTDRDVTVALSFSQGVRVTGRVVFEGSRPKPDPSVLRTRGIYLRDLDYRFPAQMPLGSAREDGTFSTAMVPPGRYVLGMLDSFEGFQLQSVKVQGKEVAGIGIEVDDNVNDALLTFSSRATTLSGTITGEPGQPRFVLVWPQEEALWSATGTQLGRIYRAVTTEGPYALPVFPGNYRIVAAAGLPPHDWESPRYLRSLVAVSQRVVVPPGQTVVQNLTPAPKR